MCSQFNFCFVSSESIRENSAGNRSSIAVFLIFFSLKYHTKQQLQSLFFVFIFNKKDVRRVREMGEGI